MNKKIILMIVIAVILVLAGSVYYFVRSAPSVVQPVGDSAPAALESGDSPIDTSPAKAGETAVSISGFAFNPKTVTIEKGSSVRWTNNESVGHDVVGDDASLGFRSPIMPQGDSYLFTFNEAGTFTYYCGVHPSMKGTVVVR